VQAVAEGSKTCAQLNINPDTNSLADLVEALQIDDPAGNISSTPLGSFPLGSFPLGSFPLGSFPLDTLSNPPLSLLTLEDFGGCQELDGTVDCSTIEALSETSSLIDVATEYGTLAASPLGSFPLGSFNIADLPLGSFPLGSFEVNGAPLGSFPLGHRWVPSRWVPSRRWPQSLTTQPGSAPPAGPWPMLCGPA